jgi:hypothetical protein
MFADSASSIAPSYEIPGSRTIRPIGASALQGIAFWGETLIAIDATSGYLLQIDPLTAITQQF